MTRRQFQWVRWHRSQRDISVSVSCSRECWEELQGDSFKQHQSKILWNITHISLFHIQTLRGRVAQVYLLTNLSIEFIFLPPVLGRPLALIIRSSAATVHLVFPSWRLHRSLLYQISVRCSSTEDVTLLTDSSFAVGLQLQAEGTPEPVNVLVHVPLHQADWGC